MINITFSNAIIVTNKGTDVITFYPVNLTTPFPEVNYEPTFTVETRKGYSEEWLITNFPKLPYEIIDLNKL